MLTTIFKNFVEQISAFGLTTDQICKTLAELTPTPNARSLTIIPTEALLLDKQYVVAGRIGETDYWLALLLLEPGEHFTWHDQNFYADPITDWINNKLPLWRKLTHAAN